MKGAWGLLGADLKEAFVGVFGYIKTHWAIYSVVMVITLGIAFGYMFPRDLDWVVQAAPVESNPVKEFAYLVSDLGDGTLFLVVLIILRIVATVRKNRKLQKLVAMYFAVCLTTSLIARVGKNLTSRPRPNAALKENISHTQFMGQTFSKSKYHSFPSGHTATSMSSALPVMMTAHPAIGVPVIALGVSCGWSRFYTRSHYVSDIFVSTVLSVLVSWAGVASYWKQEE